METGTGKTQNNYEIIFSAEKCVLLDTMYDILHLAIQDICNFAGLLHGMLFVTGLYLDKSEGLWQYIVEVDAFWHNILCLTVAYGCRCLNFKRKSRLFL